MRRRALAWGAGIGIGGFLLGLTMDRQEPKTDASTILLERVQSLGELHTARHSFGSVMEHQTHLEPAQWVSYVPGGTSLMRSATRNEALLSIRGHVEAGVDLRKAIVHKQGDRYLVQLPEPRIYEPVVDARVHEARPGWFWRDDNLALDALSRSKRELRQAAEAGGIRKLAADEAAKRVQTLLEPLAPGKVSVEVGGNPITS